MNRTTSAYANANRNQLHGPSARPACEHVSPSLFVIRRQRRRRARTWLHRNAGLLCAAAGWVLVFASLAMPPETGAPGAVQATMLLSSAGLAAIGFGIGWIVRGESDEAEGRPWRR